MLTLNRRRHTRKQTELDQPIDPPAPTHGARRLANRRTMFAPSPRRTFRFTVQSTRSAADIDSLPSNLDRRGATVCVVYAVFATSSAPEGRDSAHRRERSTGGKSRPRPKIDVLRVGPTGSGVRRPTIGTSFNADWPAWRAARIGPAGDAEADVRHPPMAAATMERGSICGRAIATAQ
jgi:hypothetical protein